MAELANSPNSLSPTSVDHFAQATQQQQANNIDAQKWSKTPDNLSPPVNFVAKAETESSNDHNDANPTPLQLESQPHHHQQNGQQNESPIRDQTEQFIMTLETKPESEITDDGAITVHIPPPNGEASPPQYTIGKKLNIISRKFTLTFQIYLLQTTTSRRQVLAPLFLNS